MFQVQPAGDLDEGDAVNQNSQMPMLPLIQLPMMGGQSSPQEEEPARVRIALEVLQHLSFKTMIRAAVNDLAIEQIDGQELTTGESNLQATACNFLNDYLAGKMKPDRLERVRERLAYTSPVGDELGMLIRCFNCAPQPPSPTCPFCHGKGNVLVYPNS